jgi:hypothetical protein
MLCIDYYEARQRKNRANSRNDCHSRVEVSRQQAQKKMCLDFVRAIFNTSVWLQPSGRTVFSSCGAGADPSKEQSKKAAVVPYWPWSARWSLMVVAAQ